MKCHLQSSTELLNNILWIAGTSDSTTGTPDS